jgi:hypothetical protein
VTQTDTLVTQSTVDGTLRPTTDVSAYLRVPVKTLYQWRYLGRGSKAYTVGRHRRYKPSRRRPQGARPALRQASRLGAVAVHSGGRPGPGNARQPERRQGQVTGVRRELAAAKYTGHDSRSGRDAPAPPHLPAPGRSTDRLDRAVGGPGLGAPADVPTRAGQDRRHHARTAIGRADGVARDHRPRPGAAVDRGLGKSADQVRTGGPVVRETRRSRRVGRTSRPVRRVL